MNRKLLPRLLFLTFLLISTGPVVAGDYKVEALIFENLEQHSAYEDQDYQLPQKPAGDAPHWPLKASMLLQQSAAIKSSPEYRLLRYLSWGQESLPLSESASRQINDTHINGWIKIYAGQLLFANLDLDVFGYRMVEKRRLKLNELHYFDHPRFGVLLRVSRLEAEAAEEQ